MTEARSPLEGTHLALRLAGVLPFIASIALGSAAWAQQSPYYLGVAASYQVNDNLLRLANDQPATVGSKSDSVTTATLLAGFDQHLGRQRAFANASVRSSRYAKNTSYNNQGYTASGGLDWSTVERLSGSLSGTVNRSLANFLSAAVNQLPDKNIQDTQALNARFNLGLVTQYSLLATLSHYQLHNSSQGFQYSDFNQDNGSLGVRWTPREQTTLGLGLSGTRGRYPKYGRNIFGETVDDRFRQTGVDVTAQVTPSGASVIDGRLSYSKTTYDRNNARDFSGVTGTVGWAWQPRARLRINTRLSRDTGQSSYALQLFDPLNGLTDSSQLSSQLVTSLRVQADYEVTAKVAVTSSLQYTQRKIVNSVVGGATSDGKDATTVFALGARWSPLRSVSAGCDLSTEQRTASGAGSYALKNNAFSCFAQFQLQQ